MDIRDKIKQIKYLRLKPEERILTEIVNNIILISTSQFIKTSDDMKDSIKSYNFNGNHMFIRNAYQKTLWVSKKTWKTLSLCGLSDNDIRSLVYNYTSVPLELDGFTIGKSAF